ncbi:MAG TPA: class F sortase [Candidatus Dormibacteraeota bacterium]
MASRGPASVPGANLAVLLSAVGLAGLMVVTLAFSWSDGTHSGTPFDAVGPTPSTVALAAPAVNDLSPPRLFQVTPAEHPQAWIPTAPPVQLLIASMDVHRAVEAVGLNRRGVMNLPVNWWNAGWYKGGPVPGAPGDAVIEGHAGYPDEPLIFGRLATLRTGDKIVVVLADGSRHLFLVASMKKVAVGSAPPGMAEPYGPPRLTLITCAGSFDKDHFSYSQRLVVEASYAGLV